MGMELAEETIWFDKWRYDDAETKFHEQKTELQELEQTSVCVQQSDTSAAPSKASSKKVEALLQQSQDYAEQSVTCCKQSEVLCKQSQALLEQSTACLQQTSTDGGRASVCCRQTTSSDATLSGQATAAPLLGSLANQIARAREDIQNSRAASGRVAPASAASSCDVVNRITKLEGENSTLRNTVQCMEKRMSELTARLQQLECSCISSAAASSSLQKPSTAAQSEPMEDDDDDDDDDDDVDLFGSDEEEEDAEAARVREERLKAYAEKKSKKVGPVAKSSVLLDCKPWADDTDMKAMEVAIRQITMDGLNWGAGKFVPLAFGIHKLSILCIVEDEKVSIDDLSEQIEALEEYVQSVDVAAFNKI